MTPEQEFRTRLAAVLADLEDEGRKDAEAMWLLGSLASDLARDLKAPSWTTAKSLIGPKAYDALLATFEKEGNRHHAEGRVKHAYAIQALALSLIAPTQPDLEVRQGGALLDSLIERAVVFYRQSQPKPN